jgi:DNA invertase Pin-like site-specific DNA recombinase
MARRTAQVQGTKTTAAVAYLRVSTDEQSNGPKAQRDAIARWAKREGVTIVAWHCDEGVSGGAALDKRPQLQAAREAMAETGATVLVAAKRDRLARDTMLAAMLERLVTRKGGRIATADGVSCEDTPEGQLMRTMVDAFAQYERQLIRARTSSALRAKRSRGEKCSRDAHYGVAVQGSALVASKDEQVAVARILELRASGTTYRAIVEAMNNAAKTDQRMRARGARWHLATVQRIIKRYQNGDVAPAAAALAH